jgi:hypothetical protein
VRWCGLTGPDNSTQWPDSPAAFLRLANPVSLKRAGGDTAQRAGLFREGRDNTPDISCLVEAGAALTVEETTNGGSRFRKFKPYPGRG